ncbi:GspH/FimT family pseudopilin [Dyella humicola]|uniref:GspH/FimT family pseudopilin n=1 Tax=Dyella humicola TaxID=2992126 RepID=UPI00225A6808|nr:GspH/FimT family pseudopilin [Dyella humicola]
MKRISSHAKGVTLIELMVTLAIMAILAVFAVPAFRDSIRRNQVASSSNALLADLSYARTEAANRGLAVSVCPTTDGQNCLPTKTYDTGWMVYSYTPGNAVANTIFNPASATNLLLRYTQARQGVSIQSNYTANSYVISFNGQGQQLPIATAAILKFATCYRDNGTGTGTSTASVQGVELDLSTSGSTSTQPWAVGAACAP